MLFDATDSDGAPTSGSMAITDGTGSGTLWTVSQCGAANPIDGQVLAVRTRITSPLTTAPSVRLSVEFFASPDCSGNPLSTLSGGSVSGDTAGEFRLLQVRLSHTDETDTVESARYIITVDGGPAADFEALLDDAVFYIDFDFLFEDGFEDREAR